ncbi:MBL fold metallo-hydrolase [Flavilitoribacter nigricans]|uniref:MBL fold hydrolase n=1 Tax=Flavilitoribacter nigricans (strain ATCC 23147 / DSM 23189 / NBRC 102662 / NCIMB 1420 / SS-2) TaxID=1122177 RepID=A0A2D0NFH9_FLAN2|nr:MBL fold metallo-hydrolase [Flavilitoribacter nigricans]PHN07254.1 MBL fold hydrolase [Flavilitoribacter nigricans DSM 23189 = NBRC 102662]
MANVVKLTFNDFQENTYIVYDDTGECIIFDPGCFRTHEEEELVSTIQKLGLTPVRLINTHCHLDHVFGNKFVAEHFGLGLEIHRGELPVLEAVPQVCMMYGLPPAPLSPAPTHFIEEGDIIEFGETKLEVLFTPGHSPASISFYCRESNFLIAGDVLFYGSIGRTDLPGGDFDTLIGNIKNKILVLPDDTVVYPGHGPKTTVAFERANNPFL